jgi:hypothetical protein
MNKYFMEWNWSLGSGLWMAWSGIHFRESKHNSMALVFGHSDTDPV